MYRVIKCSHNKNRRSRVSASSRVFASSAYSYEEWEDDYREDDEILLDFEEEYDMYQLEDKVAASLGVYCDFSGIRGGYGTIFIYSDPNHENNADMWMGSDEDLITKVNYSDYTYDMITKVMIESNGNYESAYRELLKSYINK